MNLPHRERLLSVVGTDFSINRGIPHPAGATLQRGGVNFSVFSSRATAVTLAIFLPDESEPIAEFPLDPKVNRTGDMWHCFISGIDPQIRYGYRIEGTSCLPDVILLDPAGCAVARTCDPHGVRQFLSVVAGDPHDWRYDQPIETPWPDSVIYELHVRGFTRHPSSGAQDPGTFAGLVEKIPYLRKLGVTAVELMPVADFDEDRNDRFNPVSGQRLKDYWGYNPISFRAPHQAYSASNSPLGAIAEFKECVRRFHEAGIEVILDVVFNHTGEGSETGPTLCWRGIDERTYYLLDPRGVYLNYSGCGNTMNCNHPVVRSYILETLRYWVMEMHVDGFRFDLASILGRGQDGSVLANPPMIEMIAADPVLARTKLIAEAWDAAGLYQVGTFPAWGRWAEWNGRFRDEVRRFVKGDQGMAPLLATRLAGSADLYQGSGRQPFHSVNFVTCHDGFTLADLVSYNEKHNLPNGEGNADGANDNHSWNCGAEGPTGNLDIHALRARQQRNFAALLLLSHGTPMLLAGDELGHSQGGNNNAWCQDDEHNWLDWRLAESNHHLLRFFRCLIALRRRFSLLRKEVFDPVESGGRMRMTWHGRDLNQADWSEQSRLVCLHVFESDEAKPGNCEEDPLYIAANSGTEEVNCALPALQGRRWMRFLDTSMAPPDDVADPESEGVPVQEGWYRVQGRSVVLLVGR